ncbi:MAG: hypothetical protein ABI790_17600 [Betaproteobacteria bacterium]
MKLSHRIPLLCASVFDLVPLTASAAIYDTAWQVADLRSFFHGDPSPPAKAPPPKQLAVVSTAQGVAADAQIEGFLRGFADAIKARDGKALLPRLSEKYTIDDLPSGLKAGDFFLQAIEQITGPNEIVITALESRNNIRTAKIEFRYNADKIKSRTFQFDAAGRLLWSDLFTLQSRRADA